MDPACKEACKEYGFRPYAGDDASGQPPDIPDVLLHETAVAWARNYFKKYPVDKGGGLDAMKQQFTGMLKDCAVYVNGNYEVDELCRSFPTRLEELAKVTQGERLRH